MRLPADYRDVVSPVLDHARRRPDAPAFVFEGRTTTYGELADGLRRAASVLVQHGVGKGDRVAILSPNRVEIFTLYLGAALIGAATIPINAEYSGPEIHYILAHSEPALLIATEDLKERADEGMAGLAKSPCLLDMDLLTAEAADARPIDGVPAGRDDDLVLVCYTSGTTAAPKGVAATHANEIASAAAYCGMWVMQADDRVLVALPLTFSFGFHAATYVALLAGATTLLLPRFHPRHVIAAIGELRATTLLGVPTMYAMMVDYVRTSRLSPEVGSLRLAVASGAALNEQAVEDCRAHLGFAVCPYYAMTEVRPIFSCDLRRTDTVPKGSVGTLIAPTEARVLVENGAEARAGEVGELLVRGPSFSGAYFRDPERTVSVLDNGWFKTGDLAFRDAGGFYYIVGRTRDQIISGGAKIAPVEVEDALLKHPGIAASAVIGVPDPVLGEVVKAFVVKADPALTTEHVVAHCQARLAAYKVPKLVTFLDALPVAPSGKVLKSLLIHSR